MFGQHTTSGARELIDERYDDEIEDDDSECCLCSGSLTVLGTLGNRIHLRCRNCGMDQSRKVS